jgi:hypothetical protein
VPRGFLATGDTLDRFDEQVLEPVSAAMGESADMLSGWFNGLRRTRIGVSTAAALGVVAILLAATVLAATGHFPVTIR